MFCHLKSSTQIMFLDYKMLLTSAVRWVFSCYPSHFHYNFNYILYIVFTPIFFTHAITGIQCFKQMLQLFFWKFSKIKLSLSTKTICEEILM